ncbi:MAG: phosphotransferase family protein [Moraxellaceae bacterium]|nr:phosphotransferase family protein [Moraxellaceae bacterium]MDZ4296882.1 phosphotransferase family protein [Moraxellaceae bacterium]MDZ4386563.1 phosphotransferase family protein [Moraxellaceae bacterium]
MTTHWWSGDALTQFLSRQFDGRSVQVLKAKKLSGGAVQENWSLDIQVENEVPIALVMRSDAATQVQASLSREQEFRLLQVVYDAGVTVPRPFWLGDETLSRACFFMERVAGTAAGHRLVKDDELVPDRSALAFDIGQQMARLHRVLPDEPRLAFLSAPEVEPARQALAVMAQWLDQHHQPHPALRWALCWLQQHCPPACSPVLTHRDLRTGNYMVDQGRLTAVLDWEFAAWSDPGEDLGWFCAACWRFGRVEYEAGGIGPRADFLAGYQAEAGWVPAPEVIRFWEIFAHLRWAIIALQQADRVTIGGERSLELALTGQLVPGLECQLLLDTGVALGHDLADVPVLAIVPESSQLIALAHEALLRDLLPALPTHQHYSARMVANVLSMIKSQLVVPDKTTFSIWQSLDTAVQQVELALDNTQTNELRQHLGRLTHARYVQAKGRPYPS